MRGVLLWVLVLVAGCPDKKQRTDAGMPGDGAREVRYETLFDKSVHGDTTCGGSITRALRGCIVERSVGTLRDDGARVIGDYSCLFACGERYKVCDAWFVCACVDAGPARAYGPDDAGNIWVREAPCED